MNKIKMFFIAAALVLTTAGVFAGKAKFNVTGGLYAYKASTGTWFPVVNTSVTLQNLASTGTNIAVIEDNSGTYYPLYSSESTSNPLYVTGF